MATVPGKTAIYESADKFRQNCLVQGTSLIWQTQPSWSVENINGLDQLIMGNPDVGERDFFAKLHDQLSGASDDIHRVAVDVLAFYYLFPSKYPGPSNKLEALSTVISWRLKDSEADLSLVSRAFDEGGLGRGGMAYHVQRPSQIHFFLQLAARIKSEHIDARDAKAVQRIADSLASEIQFARSARNVALHLLYPEVFERTASDRHKKLMVEGFRDRAGDYSDIDDALMRIRQSFVSEGQENFDFYNPEIRTRWEVPEKEEEPPAKGKRVWIFQANPKYYDVDSAVRELSEQTWLAAQSTKQIQVGDTAYIWKSGPEAGIIAVGSVMTEPAEMLSADGEDKYNRAPERLAGKKLRVRLRIDKVLSNPIKRAQLKSHPKLSSLTILSFANATNFSVRPEQAQALEELIANEQSSLDSPRPIETERVQPEYSLSQLATETNISESLLATWISAIERKGQAILYGPPGTGKTFVSERLARHLVGGGDGFWELVQFHPSYAYEDFIQGIRPKATKNGGLDYSTVSGRFLDFCNEANTRKQRCVLIIDEINRANLSRVFGELMYLLEYRDRDAPLSGGGRLCVPQNIRVIGTMNTADRSIALVDHALRRRFAFVALRPDYEILRKFHSAATFNVEGLITTLKRLNAQINDHHYEVGITFFLTADLKQHLEAIWTMEIEPYLEEYFFDQPDTVDSFRWARVSASIL